MEKFLEVATLVIFALSITQFFVILVLMMDIRSIAEGVFVLTLPSLVFITIESILGCMIYSTIWDGGKVVNND